MEKIDFSALANVPYGPNYYRRVAEAVIVHIPGASFTEAVDTESVYIHLSGGAEIRLSSHAQYGSNRPTHVQVASKKSLPFRMDRAVRAALSGSLSYKNIPDWGAL